VSTTEKVAGRMDIINHHLRHNRCLYIWSCHCSIFDYSKSPGTLILVV